MEIFGQKKFSSPQEEIAFLKSEIARREQELLRRNKEIDSLDKETIGRSVLEEYAEHEPSVILDKKHAFSPHRLTESHAHVEVAAHKVEEVIRIAETEGIRNALSLIEKMK